ncbi:MAG: helix-turn-helix domain-containing protein [Candidatus Hodarchaeota archaeon]
MLYSYVIEIEHKCPFSEFSRSHPEIEIQLWCNNGQHDILELKGENTALERAVIDLEKELGTITRIFPERNQVQIVFNICKCNEFPLNPIFDRYDCLELPPVRYFAGREIMNLLVTAEDAGLILEDIRRDDSTARVKVLKLAPLKKAYKPNPLFLPLDDLRKNLTVKQQQALSSAFNKGYYELPRRVFLEVLAKEAKIHRRTFEEHLRKAEKKIMTALIPSLSLS